MAKVDILNYISDSNILRSTYDTDTNQLEITDIPQNLNSVITLGQGGGGSVTVEELNVTENGTYEAPEGKAYSPVNVNVPVGWTSDGIADFSQPSGDIVLTVNEVGERAFFKRPITSVYSSTVAQLNNYSFANCSELKSVDFPNLTNSAHKDRGYLFQSCTNLESVNLPLLQGAYTGYNFSGCSKLTEVYLPSYDSATGSDFFSSCPMLTTVDLGSCSRIDNNCFKNDSSFTTLILRRSTVTPLNSTNIFNGTPFASGGSGGTIYVPSNLLSSYPTATNWSTVNGYGTITWKAIEGSIYE